MATGKNAYRPRAICRELGAVPGISAVANTYTWTTSSGTAWSNSTYWTANGVPVLVIVARFAGTTYSGTSVLTASSTVGGLWDSAGNAVTISNTTAGLSLTLMATSPSTAALTASPWTPAPAR